VLGRAPHPNRCHSSRFSRTRTSNRLAEHSRAVGCTGSLRRDCGHHVETRRATRLDYYLDPPPHRLIPAALKHESHATSAQANAEAERLPLDNTAPNAGVSHKDVSGPSNALRSGENRTFLSNVSPLPFRVRHGGRPEGIGGPGWDGCGTGWNGDARCVSDLPTSPRKKSETI